MTAEHEARTQVKVEMRYSHAFPSREARLGGWDAWVEHMLSLNRQHVLAIVKPRFIVMVPEDVFAMAPERREALLKEALSNVPRLSLRARVTDYFIGTYRYAKKRVSHG